MEQDLRDLSSVAIHSALELDNYLKGREYGNFSSLYRLTEVIGTHMNENFPNPPLVIALWHAMKKSSDKEIKTMDEFTLETRLLHSEMSQVDKLPGERLEVLKDFCIEMSRMVMEYCPRRWRYGFVA